MISSNTHIHTHKAHSIAIIYFMYFQLVSLPLESGDFPGSCVGPVGSGASGKLACGGFENTNDWYIPTKPRSSLKAVS